MAEHPRKDRPASGSRQRTRRQQALRAQGATHPHPEAVIDPLFRDSAFFDPNDLVQVKYEMLRSVQQEERSVVEAAQASGLSRPAFYVTQELFQREGLPGLLPHKRGPKRPHKLSDEAMAVLAREIQEAGRKLKGEELAALLARRFGIEAHPRSILRRLLPYLRREEKKLR
jgi:transposase